MVDTLAQQNNNNRPSAAMSSKACAFSIAALVGDDIIDNDDDNGEISADDFREVNSEDTCISPIGRFITCKICLILYFK